MSLCHVFTVWTAAKQALERLLKDAFINQVQQTMTSHLHISLYIIVWLFHVTADSVSSTLYSIAYTPIRVPGELRKKLLLYKKIY